MTANQIAYQANLERERSNRASESIQQMNAESQRVTALAKADQTKIEELKARLAEARNPYEIEQIKAEIARTKQAAKLDVANTVISGVGALTNLGKVATGAYSAISSASTAAGQLGLARDKFQASRNKD